MNFEFNDCVINIYGDGDKEYEGYYLVIVSCFFDRDNPNKETEHHNFYVKAENIQIVKKALKQDIFYFINYRDNSIFELEERIIIKKVFQEQDFWGGEK